MSTTPDNIAARVKRLETYNRILLTTILLLFSAILYGQWQTTKSVSTKAFNLIDDSGLLRASFSFKDGNPGLYIQDAEGKDRILLSHTNESTALYILDETGTTRLGAAQFAHGGGGFAVHGQDAKGAAVMYLKENGSLRIFNKDGKVVQQSHSHEPEVEQ